MESKSPSYSLVCWLEHQPWGTASDLELALNKIHVDGVNKSKDEGRWLKAIQFPPSLMALSIKEALRALQQASILNMHLNHPRELLKNTEKSNSWISPPDSVLPGWGADAEPDCRVMVFNIKGSLMARIHMRIFSFIWSMTQNFWIMMKLCHSLCCMEPWTLWASDGCWLILTVINLSLNPSEHLLMRNPVLPCHCEWLAYRSWAKYNIIHLVMRQENEYNLPECSRQVLRKRPGPQLRLGGSECILQ